MLITDTDTLPFRHATHGDVVTLARLLLTFMPSYRAKAARHAITCAINAETHRRTTGKAHVEFGSGDIQTAVTAYAQRVGRDLPPEPSLSDPDYLDSMIVALTAIRDAVSDRAWDRLQAEAV